MKKKCSDDEFIALFRKNGAAETARILGSNAPDIFKRRRNLEKKLDIQIISRFIHPKDHSTPRVESNYPTRFPLDILDGTVIIFSDAHYWPGIVTCAHRAAVYLIQELKPVVVIANGDMKDGARTSRHAPIGWSHTPTEQDEQEAVDQRLTELRDACPKAKRIWTLGNHDMRFENALAAKSPEFKNVQGFALSDHFPEWKICMSIWINDHAVVKHRWKGGVHAAHNNTAAAGKSIFTGHLHSLKVTPYADYNGNRYGVDTGTLADPYGPQFEYGEDNPLNHRSGFVVATFHKGMLLWPEVCRVIDEKNAEFRGQILSV